MEGVADFIDPASLDDSATLEVAVCEAPRPMVDVEAEVEAVVFVLVDKDGRRLVSLALIRDARSGAMAAGVSCR